MCSTAPPAAAAVAVTPTAAAAAAAVVSAADVMREVARALHSDSNAPASPSLAPNSATPTAPSSCGVAPMTDDRPQVFDRSPPSSSSDDSPLSHSRDRPRSPAFDEFADDEGCRVPPAVKRARLAYRALMARKAANQSLLNDEMFHKKPHHSVSATLPSLKDLSPFPNTLPTVVVSEFCDLLAEDINACDHEGLTPLYRAAAQNSREHVALLLAAPEIDVDAVCGRPMPTSAAPLLPAPVPSDGVVEPVLQNNGAENPLVVTATENPINTVEHIMTDQDTVMHVPPAEPEPDPDTPLLAPAGRRSPSSAAGATPALVAAFRGHYEVLTMLVAHGANLTLKDNIDYTVMRLATMNPKVQRAIANGRVLRQKRLLATGKALLTASRDLPVDLAALIVSCTYQ